MPQKGLLEMVPNKSRKGKEVGLLPDAVTGQAKPSVFEFI